MSLWTNHMISFTPNKHFLSIYSCTQQEICTITVYAYMYTKSIVHGSIGNIFLNTKMYTRTQYRAQENETSLSGEGTSNNWQLAHT